MVENRNDNFETDSQLDGKEYITSAELKELKTIHKYDLVFTNKEDTFLRYKDFVSKMIWKKEEEDDDSLVEF